jgi:hypothetical protein
MNNHLLNNFIDSRRNLVVLILFVFLGLFATQTLKAQFGINLELNRENYLLHESVFAKVSIRNYSGRTLVFGKIPELSGRIEFDIYGPNGELLRPYNQKLNPMDGVILNSGATTDVVIPLSRMYHFSRAGSYTIKAILAHSQLESTYVSKVSSFFIFNGFCVWERKVGVPDVFNNNIHGKIKTRSVRLLNFYDNRKKLFALCIEDKKYVYAVIRLNADIGNKPPQCQIDGLSLVHILTQISPKVFSYYVYDLNGKLQERVNYARSNSVNPRLIVDSKQGVVTVAGGRKALKGKDYKEVDPSPIFRDDNK